MTHEEEMRLRERSANLAGIFGYVKTILDGEWSLTETEWRDHMRFVLAKAEATK